MILIWGVPKDSPAARVAEALEQRGEEVFFLNQHEVLDAELEMSVDAEVRGVVRSGTRELRLEAIAAAYLRPYESRRLASVAAAPEYEAAIAAEFDEAMLCWSEVTRALVVNRPSAMASNHSKPYQLALIATQGFAVPETLITTDPDAAESFWQKHGDVIYKSVSGVRSIVSRLTPEHRARFDSLAHCPTQFQQWIPGRDWRVHVVGDEVFACEVASNATDYRYPGDEEETAVTAESLPEDLSQRCRLLTRALRLEVAGIDLRRTPDGEWYCFEVNPSPGFTFYEAATGQPIADAIARLLATGAAPEETRDALRPRCGNELVFTGDKIAGAI